MVIIGRDGIVLSFPVQAGSGNCEGKVYSSWYPLYFMESAAWYRVFMILLLILACFVTAGSGQGSDQEIGQGVQDQNVSLPAKQVRPGWTPGVTSLSNLTPEQKKKYRGLKDKPANQSIIAETPPIAVPSDLPESFDWRDNDGDWTTPVRDQGEDCGSCWSYAVTGILESYLKIQKNDPSQDIYLAEQYLVSCDMDDDGCDGGDFETALPYLVDKPGPDGKIGTVSADEYPYTGRDDSCRNLAGLTRYHADRWAYVNGTAEAEEAELSLPTVDELKAAIFLKGPIAAGIYDDDEFDEYDGGVFYSETEYTETNHAVILVGWGNEDGEEFFIGKNSAGTEWGEDGWFRIEVDSSRIGEGAVYLDSDTIQDQTS